MKRALFIFTTILLLSGCFQYSQDLQTSKIKDDILKVGFCPTMQEEAVHLKEKNENMELVPFVSAGEVLRNLNSKTIDAGLVGRKAKKSEITEDIREKRLEQETHTLITKRKQAISENDLRDLEINTCLNEETLESYPELNIHFKDCDYKNGQPWLISWDDFSDELELLIPVNEFGEKIKKFRTAHFYTSLSINTFHF